MGLDFIVIGAGKSGTTSLWGHLREHPEIWMPESKEAPFFSSEERYARGLEWLMRAFFSRAPSHALLGKATPQYMAGKPGLVPQVIAGRISAALPDVKLVAILRDPIERALSDHRMYVRLEQERRSFTDAMADLLESRSLEAARWGEPGVASYVVQGEYGRILAAYLGSFPRDALFVCFTEELEQRPGELLGRLHAFLGVDAGFLPASLETRLLEGGIHPLVSRQAADELFAYLDASIWSAQRPPSRSDWRKLNAWLRQSWSGSPPAAALDELAAHLRARIRQSSQLPRLEDRQAFQWWFSSAWNVQPEPAPPIDEGTREALERHYLRDAEVLEHLTGVGPPWPRRWASMGERGRVARPGEAA